MIFKINLTVINYIFFSIAILVVLTGCGGKNKDGPGKQPGDSIAVNPAFSEKVEANTANVPQEGYEKEAGIKTVQPDSLVAFSRTLIGIPYLYASTDPDKGFDCSGFITYVFNHFNIMVPRSSVDFTNYGKEIAIENGRPGDLILFTGTDSTVRIVGHMGIVESIRSDTLHFIHSTSGNARGVVISPLGDYYEKRFIKLIRVFSKQFF